MKPKYFVNTSDNVFEDKRLCNESTSVSVLSAVSHTTYLLCIFIGSLSVLIMCGNLLVITSIVYFKQLHTPTNYLILSLAVADLLVGVFVLPFSTMLAVSSCWYLQNLLCKVRGCFDIFLCTCSIFHLCFISVDRYYAVCQPLTYRTKINVNVTMIMILVSWTVPALNGIISITISGFNQVHSNQTCVLFQSSRSGIIRYYYLCNLVFVFYLPVVIFSTIYLKILMAAQRQVCSIHNITCHSRKTKAAVSKIERKATKTLAVVVGVFLMCWSPFFLCMTLNPLIKYTVPVTVIAAFKWFGWSNSMLNPFVYAFFYSWFRSAFKMIISGKIFHSDLTYSKI